MHDDHHHPAPHSTFDPALFDQLVYSCVNRVPRGRVTTYGKSTATHDFFSAFFPHYPFLPHQLPTQDTLRAFVTIQSTRDTLEMPCDASLRILTFRGSESSMRRIPFPRGGTEAQAPICKPLGWKKKGWP